jgi:hypothetical protein
MSDKERGDVLLHDRYAIGLRLDQGAIGLHKIADHGMMVGVRMFMGSYGYRKKEATSGLIILQEAEFHIPGPESGYTGRISEWDHYKTTGHIVTYKARECQFLPDHEEYTTFALLDAYEETDPWFYFGWGTRTEQLTNPGTHYRICLGRFGVNYPVQDGIRPGWSDIPVQEQLKRLLKPGAPSGNFSINAKFSSFTVDPEVSQQTRIYFSAIQGQRRYHIGVLDFVKEGEYAVGEFDADWQGVQWIGYGEPAEIKMLTGSAAGQIFPVTKVEFTGSNPPPGYPMNIWLIWINCPPFPPSSRGIKAGDKYILKSFYNYQSAVLLDQEFIFSPGSYGQKEYEFTFKPIL